jgi:acetyl-CoA carboxylase carboxyl transferase subunit alpha
MLEHAYYSVISPEGAAAILWKDAAKAQEAAEALKITAPDLDRLGVVDDIIPEPKGGAHRNPEVQSENVKNAIVKHLEELLLLTPEQLIEDRYGKYAKIGQYKAT